MEHSGNNMEIEYKNMGERLTQIEGQVGEIGREVTSIGGNVLKISEALRGNEFNKLGLLDNVERLTAKVLFVEAELKRIDEKHEKRFAAVKWVIIGLSLASGFGISELINFLSK
jgi:hypothetical protein